MHVETRDDCSQADSVSVTIASPISPCSDTTITPLSKHTTPEQRARIRLASASVMFFVLGWGDGGEFQTIHIVRPPFLIDHPSDWHSTSL